MYYFSQDLHVYFTGLYSLSLSLLSYPSLPPPPPSHPPFVLLLLLCDVVVIIADVVLYKHMCV